MSEKFDRLIHSLEFLTSHREDASQYLTPAEADALEKKIAACMREILSVDPTDLSAAISQTRVLMSAICNESNEPKKADCLRSICEDHLDRLRMQLANLGAQPPLPSEMQCLDSLTERVSFFDTDYRYVYTNASNCEFHREPAGNFVGRPNWAVVGDRFFEQINKARFDACYAGKRISYYNGHPSALGRVFSVTFDPTYDSAGRVTGAIVMSRDVSLLPIPGNLILQIS